MTTLSVNQKRDIMTRANRAGLTVNGVPVQVAGIQHDFAKVIVAHPHPLAGFVAEYGWHVIDHAARHGYKLKN